MARPKEFDVAKTLDLAMALFWKQGYRATSTESLVTHLGIGRQSMYNTFGDKHTLFLASLDRYQELTNQKIQHCLQEAKTPIAGIQNYFRFILESTTQNPSQRSCFMANSAMELGLLDEVVRQKVKTFFLSVEEIFYQVLQKAKKEGEIAKTANVKSLARYVTNMGLSIGIMAKVGIPISSIEDTINVALSSLKTS